MGEPVSTKGPERPADNRAGSLGLVLALILFALALFLVRARLEPPAPVGTNAPATAFSAGRSIEVLRLLAGDGSAHPVGSAAHARIREVILAELRRLGYAPSVQDGVACGAHDTCARLLNVVARLEGTSRGKAVLLMAHYDSVFAGPGVGDDLSGVATMLEVARALKSGPPPKNPVIFLFTDGEEMGLLGAELFASRHPTAREVGVVVNLEARGTAGPSLMFETIGDDAWTVREYAEAAPRPVTSSVYSTIYEAMPNDTDLTVFRHRGHHGLNFAFVRNPTHYHSTEDNVENLSAATLQHHGDNALAAVRGLAQADLNSPPKGDAVFFDVLGLGVVRWPQGWTPGLGILALALTVAAGFRALRREGPRRGLLFGLLAFLGAVVLAALLSAGLNMLLQGASPYAWVADPQADLAAFWLLSLAVVLGLAAALSRRAGAAGLWAGVWIGWAVLGLAVALTAPGISYLFLVPALIAGIVGLVSRAGGLASSLVPALVAVVLWLPILLPLYDGLGRTALVVVGVLAAALFTTLAPLAPSSGALGRRWLPLASLVLALVCVGLAYASAPYSEESPQPLTLLHYQQADTGEALWLARGARPLPAALRQAAQFSTDREPAYPWSQTHAFVAPAPRLDAPGPQISVLEDSAAGGKRRLRVLLVSNRRAPWGSILVPKVAKVESVRVDGQEVPGGQGRKRALAGQADWREIVMAPLPPEGVEIELVLGETQPQEWYALDVTSGLPPSAAALLQARPETAVSYQEGDSVVISRKIRI